MKVRLIICLLLLMLGLQYSPVLGLAVPPEGQPITEEFEQMLEKQNQQILTFYEDAIAAGIALLIILFQK